ncbi:MAG: ATP-binding protein [Candidatus Aenigmarchaeota archaeon]|nr:ATP-binding protein [Candidatus Aenigmarchaeota archaeon]
MEIISQIINGAHGEIILREKSDQPIELGEIVVAEDDENNKILLQVYDLMYGSQLDDKRMELASGLSVEDKWKDLVFYDPELRHYVLAKARALAQVKNGESPAVPKRLPKHFSMVRRFSEADKEFIARQDNPLFLGNLRSGSRVLNMPVHINGLEALSHHMLIAATTGRGKSNFLKVVLWDAMDKGYCGILVLDPHDEYYEALEKNPASRENLFYYTNRKGVSGAYTLRVDVKTIKPDDVTGVIDFTPAQEQAIIKYRKEFGDNWLLEIARDRECIFEKEGVHPGTLSVVQRKIHTKLGVRFKDGDFICDNEVFDVSGGEKTIDDICSFLSSGRKVIIDTSMLMDEAELLVGSIIANRVLENYKAKKAGNRLKELPVIAIAIEEAPRVLAEDKINQANNIYATIAREGRKFKIGLIAITQLSSVIPREIMANMNTKVIFGNELAVEREAIISSASQDLSKDGKNIASLNKGEAIISSIFTNFAIPVKVPSIDELIKSAGPRPVAQRKVV